jgi:hypothetical protein
MRNSTVLAAALFMIVATTSPIIALADSPTHVFHIYSASTAKDRAACSVKASLTLLKRVSPQAIKIDFRYHNPHNAAGNDPGDVTLSFSFSNFQRSKARTVVEEVPGVDCQELTLTSPSLSCADPQGECAGSVLVDIKARKSPRLKAQRLSN